jgi:hypothetical protein
VTRWGEPKQESWASALVAWIAYIAVGALIFIGATSVPPPQ